MRLRYQVGIKLVLLLFATLLTVGTREAQVSKTDYNDYVRDEAVENYKFTGVTNFNEWARGHFIDGSTLHKERVIGQMNYKHYKVKEDTDEWFKLEGFKHDIKALTYDDIFTKDPHEYAKITTVFVWVVYTLVILMWDYMVLARGGYYDRDDYYLEQWYT